MEATRELITALVAGGMDAAEAAGLVARAAVEMTASVTRKSTGALRQQRYRERNKASRNVTGETQMEASPNVTKRNEGVTCDAGGEKPPLILPSSLSLEGGLSRKKESKKERVQKKRNAPLPENWQPPPRAFDVAAELGLTLPPIEARFRDYLKSSGRLYADHDAAFCNFIRMTPKFGGSGHGNGTSNHSGAGRATAREAQHVATMGGAALRYLQEGNATGQRGDLAGSASPAEIVDLGKRAENGR